MERGLSIVRTASRLGLSWIVDSLHSVVQEFNYDIREEVPSLRQDDMSVEVYYDSLRFSGRRGGLD